MRHIDWKSLFCRLPVLKDFPACKSFVFTQTLCERLPHPRQEHPIQSNSINKNAKCKAKKGCHLTAPLNSNIMKYKKVLPTPRQDFTYLFHYENFIYHKMTRITTILQLFVDKIRFYKLLCYSIVQNKSSNRFFRSFRIYSNHWILREIKWRILKT